MRELPGLVPKQSPASAKAAEIVRESARGKSLPAAELLQKGDFDSATAALTDSAQLFQDAESQSQAESSLSTVELNHALG
jgi:hypothetical protein